jgi:streptogrisin D
VTALASVLVVAFVVPGRAAAGPATPSAAAALAAVDALPPTPNTAWGIDPATGQLLVTISRAAPVAGAARLAGLTGRFGGVLRVEYTDRPIVEQDLRDPLAPLASGDRLLGGNEISDGRIICSAGFNVVKDDRSYLLTAGHCTADLTDWQGVGPAVVSVFPESDYGLIRDDSADPQGAVNLYDGTVQPIRSVGTATVGMKVCASGKTTKVTCGKVTAVDQTVDYGDGNVVYGLIRTDVHTDHGDSGGSLFNGSVGLGVVSGGDGTTDYFQPLGAALTAYGLSLATP